MQYGYDPSDGEVVYSTDMWVADGTITEEQLFCMLRQLVSTLDDFHPVVLHAMETGEVDFDRVARPSEVREAASSSACCSGTRQAPAADFRSSLQFLSSAAKVIS